MKNITMLLAACVLTVGCHGRMKKNAPFIDAVRADMVSARGPSVTLPKVGGTGAVGSAINITQMVREGNIAAHISDKVDPQQVNAAFAGGLGENLEGGPPFALDPNADAVLEFELVDWGLDMPSVMSPGVFNYTLRVRGYKADGSKFYKTRIRCAVDAGGSGWSEMTPFGDNNPNRIKNLTAEEVQGIFDATAADCARQAVSTIRRHAG